jgi:Family of unknown function (DUF5706)
MASSESENGSTDNSKDKKKSKKKKDGRTVETMFRTTITNHLKLSAMADQKAGLLVSVNAIIVSIVASSMVREITTNPLLIAPNCVLLAVCLLTITYALLATRPSIKPQADTPDLANIDQMDLLFFADYTALTLEQYQTALKDIMKKEEKLQDSLIKNIYVQGQVMSRKYKLLKTAYTIFMIGFPTAVLTFAIALLWVS